jgi:hypothetical protein
MFFLTSHRAGVTADATVLIDDKAVAHGQSLDYRRCEPAANK